MFSLCLSVEDTSTVVQKPPAKLLGIVTKWIRTNPETLFAMHGTNTCSLPLRRGNPKTTTGLATLIPVQGLVAWSVLSPLLPLPQFPGGCITPLVDTNHSCKEEDSANTCSSEQEMYSLLHTVLLEALVAHTSIKTSASTSTSTYTYPVDISVFSAVGHLLNSAIEHHLDAEYTQTDTNLIVEEAVNRLAQILQVSLSHNLLLAPSMSKSL